MLGSSIKSFVLRQGKITSGQQLALDNLLHKYQIMYQPNIVNLDESFMRSAHKIIEIGFGMGQSLLHMALNNPHIDFIGIEVYKPGVGTLLRSLEQHNITNVKVIHHDAVAVLNMMLDQNCISGFNIYFPDPWPKRKQQKRRLIQADFVQLLCHKLTNNGYIHVATDCQNYGIWINDILSSNKQLMRLNTTMDNNVICIPRPTTKFEQRGLKLGHIIEDFIFYKPAL